MSAWYEPQLSNVFWCARCALLNSYTCFVCHLREVPKGRSELDVPHTIRGNLGILGIFWQVESRVLDVVLLACTNNKERLSAEMAGQCILDDKSGPLDALFSELFSESADTHIWMPAFSFDARKQTSRTRTK